MLLFTGKAFRFEMKFIATYVLNVNSTSQLGPPVAVSHVVEGLNRFATKPFV